jgi:hypothetical protein
MKEFLDVEKGQVKEVLEAEFSLSNLEAYAQACENIGIRLTEIVEEEKERKKIAILLPSRGAIPVFIGACFGLSNLGVLNKIDLPPLTCFDYMRERLVAVDEDREIKTPVLIFPFTGDVNFNNLVNSSEQQLEIRDNMRRFGARAVIDFFKPPRKRRGLEYRLFLSFLEVVEKRRGIIEFYENFPQIDRFVVIDTVISGRASWTILNEWEQNGIEIGEGGKIEPILVIDVQGKKIKENFRKYIYTCRNSYYIPRILTEDRGAALEGVVAVVYPQLILAAHENRELYPQGYPLFGSWHSIPPRFQNTYLKIFNEFLATIEAFMNNEDFEKLREVFLRDLSNEGVLSTRDSLINGRDLDLPFASYQTQETSARVIQIFYDESKVSDIIRMIIQTKQRGD